MKRLSLLIFAACLMAVGLGSGCLIADGNQDQCCSQHEVCETYCDPYGNCSKDCWFEQTCTDTCGGSGGEGSGTFCYSDVECGNSEVCVNNGCAPPNTDQRGDAGLCQACETNVDCAGDGSICVGLAGTGGGATPLVCATTCSGNADCAANFECVTIGEGINVNSYCLPVPDQSDVRSCSNTPDLECTTAADCGPAESCVGNKCETPDDVECTSTDDCSAGEVCHQYECVADNTPECATRSDCATGEVCVDGTCEGGTESCVFNEECSGEAMCVNGSCYSTCSADSDCGRLEHCRQGLCQPTECRGTSDCAGDEVCVDATCKPGCDPATSGQCAPGFVCTDYGYCDRDPNVDCRSNAECARQEICVEGSCQVPCTCNQDCPGGQVCDIDAGTCYDPGAEAPQTCETTCDCPSGQQCNASGECVAG